MTWPLDLLPWRQAKIKADTMALMQRARARPPKPDLHLIQWDGKILRVETGGFLTYADGEAMRGYMHSRGYSPYPWARR